MARWTTTQRDSMLRQVSDTTVVVAAGAVLGTAAVMGYAMVTTHAGTSSAVAAGDQPGTTAQTLPLQGYLPSTGEDQGGQDDGSQDDGGLVQGGQLPPGQVQTGQIQTGQVQTGQVQTGAVQGGFGAPTTSGGS